MAVPLLIDTDTGIDDAVALALAASLGSLDVRAVTTVHGNVEVERATRNAREVLRRTGLFAPVIAGAGAPLTRPAQPARETHGPEGVGYVVPSVSAIVEPDTAAECIVATAQRRPGLVMCCLGPLTNIARALTASPLLAGMVGPVFVMGGALGVRGTQTKWSEFNWWSDPEAARAVLRAGFDLRLVPLDVTRRVAVPSAAITQLAAAGARDDDARFWSDALRFYADFHRRYESFDGCVINDALAIALVHDASLADWRPMRLDVSTSGDEHRGAARESADGAPVQVAVSVRAADVLEMVRERVFARWLGAGAFGAGAGAAAHWLERHPLHESFM